MGLINREDKYAQTALGAQAYLTVDQVPAGSAIAVGTRLLGTLLPNGTYGCLIPISGLASRLTALLKATFGSGTVTTSGGTTMIDQATVLTNGAGVGAMATTVRQTITVSPLQGEQYAIITIVVAGGAGATFTEAEYYGN